MFAELNVIFIGLGILSLVLLLFRFSEQAKKKKIDRFISRKLFNKLVPTYSKTQRNLRFLMVFIALALMLLGIARPQWGVEQRTSNPRSTQWNCRPKRARIRSSPLKPPGRKANCSKSPDSCGWTG